MPRADLAKGRIVQFPLRRVMVNIQITNIQSVLSENLPKAHLFLPNWYRKGINLPADLIHANGDFMTERTFKK